MPAPGRVAKSVTCLATDKCLTAIPGVASSIPARSHTFVEIDHEIISTVILLPSADLFKKDCCQLQVKVCARITGYPLVQACLGKSVVRGTDRPAMTIADDLGRKATNKQTNTCQRVPYAGHRSLLVCMYIKTCVKRSLSKRLKFGFPNQLLLIVGQKYCRMLNAPRGAFCNIFDIH